MLGQKYIEKLYASGDNKSKNNTILDVVYPLLIGEPAIETNVQPILSSNNRFGVDILAGHPSLAMIEDKLSTAWSEMSGGKIGGIRISNWCSALCATFENKYDLVFFDIGPSLGSLNRTVLLGIDYFVSPMGADLFSLFGVKNIAEWLRLWLVGYKRGLSNAEEDAPGILDKFPIRKTPAIAKGFAGYTVQQYIAKVTDGVRRPTKAYEKILKGIPDAISSSLCKFTSNGVSDKSVHLGDVPHMYSLVPLAQACNAPIFELTSKDGLVGSQFMQTEVYSKNLHGIALNLAHNVGMEVKE